jgi:hypothetical protein
MVVVDAIDDRAARFYRAHGFIPLPESMRLILPAVLNIHPKNRSWRAKAVQYRGFFAVDVG